MAGAFAFAHVRDVLQPEISRLYLDLISRDLGRTRLLDSATAPAKCTGRFVSRLASRSEGPSRLKNLLYRIHKKIEIVCENQHVWVMTAAQLGMRR